FTQDDAHIYCTPDQLESEIQGVITFMLGIYRDFGLEDVRIMLSTRPEKYIGEKSLWDKLEKTLAGSLEKLGHKYETDEGAGAFYGPKLDFQVKDSLGRFWQLGTIQADMNLPERFDIHYIGEDGAKHRPIMLHRALMGSIERFLGAYLEITAGILPFWVAPLQVVAATITGEANDYAEKVVDALKMAGISAQADTRNEKIGYKIREHSLAKIPLMVVLGKKEAAENKVTLRRLGSEAQETMDLRQALDCLKKQAALPGIRYQH
ncbi:MAG: His/Gly/Thr/Pro-type tRNA ligase C-terminal domain-containing protein, partial [Alphaproteobacteria bacterium]|nr:His/Gly/Thr/Pro-type tRNA ligase C-terminal domain-containing protein [Alphaproteobacteria bacterium]